ncbi:hypothetical protein Emag_003557 [Eimeria magna]
MSSVDCAEECGPDGGTFLTTAGICECARAAQETVCDGTCKANLPTTTLEGGAVRLSDPITEELSFLTHPEVELTHAQKYCSMIRKRLSSSNAAVAAMQQQQCRNSSNAAAATQQRSNEAAAADGHSEKQPKQSSGVACFDNSRLPESPMADGKADGRQKNHRQQVLRSELQAKVVDNSLLCITIGSTIVWELQDGAFPVYLENLKKSLVPSAVAVSGMLMKRLLIASMNAADTFEVIGKYASHEKHICEASLCLRYPAPIRLRSLSLLAISITAGDLLLHPNWGFLVGVLVALVFIVLLFLFIVARFVWHRWRATRRHTAEPCFFLEAHEAHPLAHRYKALAQLLSVLPRFLRASGAAQIVHYRIRDDLVDQTATLEKLYDMREILTKVFAQEKSRETETCSDTAKLIGQTLSALQQRLDYADLKGSLPVASRHVTALLRCILSVLQGSGHSKEDAAKLYQLEKLQEQHDSEALATTWGVSGARQADILRIYVSKAGSSVYDSLDAISKAVTERRETLTECQKALTQLPVEEKEDSEGGRHILLAAVHDILAKRVEKIQSSSFKSLVSLYRHVDLAEHRISEKEAAFLNLCSACQQEMIELQDLQSLRVLKWQQDYLISNFTKNNRILHEVADPLSRALQEALTNLFTAREDQISSILSTLCGTIAAILQQNRSVSSSQRAKPPSLVEALQELQEIRQQQEAQIKTKAEKQMELFRSSLQSYTDTAIKHSRVLASREKAAIAKLSKALRKEIRLEYAAASAEVAGAAELRQQAVESATRSSQDSLLKTMNAAALLLAGYAKLRNPEEEETRPRGVDTLAGDNAKNSALEKLSQAFSRREKAVLEFEAIRLQLHQSQNEALMKTMTDFLRLTVRFLACYKLGHGIEQPERFRIKTIVAQASRDLQNVADGAQARLAEINGKAEECAKMLQSSSSTSADAELAAYSASWQRLLTSAKAKRKQESQKRKAVHADRQRGLHRSNEAAELAARKRFRYIRGLRLHVCACVIEQLQQNQGPMANERNKFLHELLHQLAIRQADVQYRSQKALLDAEQEMAIEQLESELAKIESLSRRMQGTLTQSEASGLSRSQSISPEGRLGVSEGLVLEAQAHSPGQGEERDRELSSRSESHSQAQSEAKEEKVDGGQESHTDHQSISQLASQSRTNRSGELDLSADLDLASARQLRADSHARVGREATGGAFAGEDDNLLEQVEEYLRHADMETDRERLLQDHRTQQLLYERRERLLKKKASVEAQQKKKLEELEKLKEATLEKLEHQLLQDIFDFSIEFEVEAPELEKLARQLWNESQHRHQEKLQELEKSHTKKIELAYGEFLSEWAGSHDGDVEARKLKILAAKGCEVAKGYLDETKHIREQATQFRQQRFEELRRAQTEVQRDLEKKEAAYKAHVEQRLNTVEAKWMQKLRETGIEEETKLWELQNIAEANFRERRRMIEAAAEAGRKGTELRTHVMAAKQTELLNELVADMHQLQQSLQVEKARQKATYRRKLLEKVQRRKKFILRDAAEGRKSLVKAALDQQQQILSQLRQEQFLFGPTKTRQKATAPSVCVLPKIALKFSQHWLAEARKHLREDKQKGKYGERRLNELSQEEFKKKCSNVRYVVSPGFDPPPFVDLSDAEAVCISA